MCSGMFAGHDDGSIRLWNLETGTAVDLVQHSNSVTCLVMAQVSNLDQLLFSAGKLPADTLLHQPHTWQVSQEKKRKEKKRKEKKRKEKKRKEKNLLASTY